MNSMFGGIRADSDVDLKQGRGRLPTFDAFGLLRTTSMPGASDGGVPTDSYVAAGSGNQDQHIIKASSGLVYGFTLHNVAATLRYVKVYDHASPTSAQTPKLRYPLAPNGGGVARAYGFGMLFSTAIAIRITTGAADNDTGTCTPNDVFTNFEFK